MIDHRLQHLGAIANRSPRGNTSKKSLPGVLVFNSRNPYTGAFSAKVDTPFENYKMYFAGRVRLK